MTNNQFLTHAADCRRMACVTRDEHERLTWLEMAQNWIRLADLPERPSIALDQPFSRAGRGAVV
jgi:hypothetical protein